MKTIDDISKIIRNNNQTLIKKIWIWHSEDDEMYYPNLDKAVKFEVIKYSTDYKASVFDD